MKVLVVDDDAALRRLVSRTLADSFGADVAEADDGVTALEYLLGNAVDLVILDLSMRIIGGLETLETIRRSSNHAQVPVILMTGHADEAGIRRAQRLGVTQVIAKPFPLETLRDRFSRVVGDVQNSSDSRPHLLDIASTDIALVVDSSPEFRALVRHEVGRLCTVEEAANEFAALSHCLSAEVGLLIVGATSELSSTEIFGRKVRGLKRLHDLHLIAAVAEPEPRLTGLYDAVITRSFVPDSFRSSLIKVLAPATRGRLLFHPESPTLDKFWEHARQTLETLTGEPVAMHADAPGVPAESRRVVASVEIQGQHAGWDLRIVCAMSTALEVATRLVDRKIDELSETDPPVAVGRMMTTLAQHLKDLVGAHGLDTRLLEARASMEASAVERVHDTLLLTSRRWYSAGGHEMATLDVVHLNPARS